MPAQHLFRFFVVFFLLLGSLLWWPGEAAAESMAPTGKEPLTRANNFGRPVLTPEQVLQGVLRLAEAVPKQRQLTPEMVKEKMGIWLAPLPNKRNRPDEGSFVGNMTALDWRYSLEVFQSTSTRGKIFQTEFFTKKGIDERTASFDPVCRLTLGDVDRALHKIGYTRQNSLSGQDIRYRNGEVSIQILRVIGSKAYCVRYLSIYLPDSISAGNNHG